MTASTNPSAASPRPFSVEYWAEHTPDAPALCESGRVLTYGEWNVRADRLAELLASRAGIAAGDRVAVCTQNRIEWFVSQAAIAKLGAALVPVSWRLTPAEIHYIVADSGARAFVFDAEDSEAMARVWTDEPAIAGVRSSVRLVLSVMRSHRPDVRSFDEAVAAGSAPPRFAAAGPRSIVYTSGTTGRPRGVVLARTKGEKAEAGDAGKPRAPAAAPPPAAPGTERNLLGAPLNHAAGQASARMTHAMGGCVYLMPRFDAEEALRIIAREKITTTFLVPTMLNRIVNLPDEVRAKYDVSSIRLLTTGASPCPHAVKEKVIAYFGDHCLYESYGSTEVGLVTRMLPQDHLRKPGSCGRVLDGVELKLIGDDGREVEPGGIGEIYVRTPRMIERYLNQGAPDELKGGFFATGDVGRLDADGFLYILDRKKDMIIAGGVNIYPAEIENALRKHPAVLDAAVFGIPHPEWGEQVKAVVECKDGQSVTEQELLAFVAGELAAYKRPRSIQFVREIPRNAAGKPLKAELRAPYWKGESRAV